MRIRLRAPGGQFLLTLPENATVADLLAQITEKTSIASFDIKYGYPPQPLPLEQLERTLALSQLDIKLDGETLIQISRESTYSTKDTSPANSTNAANSAAAAAAKASPDVSFAGRSGSQKATSPIALKKKTMEGDVPEIPLLDRGATMGK